MRRSFECLAAAYLYPGRHPQLGVFALFLLRSRPDQSGMCYEAMCRCPTSAARPS